MKKSLVLLIAAVALLAVALPIASAQQASPNAVATLTFSQSEINNAPWVRNPPNPHLTDLLVDLQAANGGQVTMTAVYTYVAQHGGPTSVILRVTAVPVVAAGHVYWRVTAASADGKPVTPDQMAVINHDLMEGWRLWVSTHLPNAYFTRVGISDDTITFTFVPHA